MTIENEISERKDKNLTQEEFTSFYYVYVYPYDKVFLCEWILRLLSDDEVSRMVIHAKESTK